LVVRNYIGKSKVFEDYIFNDAKDELELTEKAYQNYRDKLLAFQTSNSIGFNLIRNEKLSTSLNQHFNDTVNQIIRSDMKPDIRRFFQNFKEYYNLKLIAVGFGSLDSVLKNDFGRRNINLTNYLTPIREDLIFEDVGNKRIQDLIGQCFIKNDSIFSQLIITCDKALAEIGKIRTKAGNVENLISLLTYTENNPIKNESLISAYYCYGYSSKGDYDLRYKYGYISIFPIMLIFQTILVMLVAIVAQLIMSDKTVTEAL
jgi:hypothetical protein